MHLAESLCNKVKQQNAEYLFAVSRERILRKSSTVIRFNKLDKEVIGKIVKRVVEETNQQLSDKNIELVFDDKTMAYFIENGYEPTMGARPLKRLFERLIKIPLSKKLLFEDLKDVCITVSTNEDGEIDFGNVEQK